MNGINLIFWLIALMTVFSALIVVLSRNLIYSAVALLFTLLGIAGLYVFLWADFIAITQVLIYVGGILVLIIFGIMLTHRISDVTLSQSSKQQILGGSIILIIFIGLSYMIFNTPWVNKPAIEPSGTIHEIGKLLMIDYLLPFEVASILLLVALIGAALLSRNSK